MRFTRKAALLGAALALSSVFTLTACGDDETATKDLSGDYDVVGFWSGAPGDTPVVTPATGTATMSFDTYNITILTPLDVVSSGDYTALEDGSFTQDGTINVGGAGDQNVQCTGTWTTSNTLLVLDTTCQGARTVVQLETL